MQFMVEGTGLIHPSFNPSQSSFRIRQKTQQQKTQTRTSTQTRTDSIHQIIYIPCYKTMIKRNLSEKAFNEIVIDKPEKQIEQQEVHEQAKTKPQQQVIYLQAKRRTYLKRPASKPNLLKYFKL